MGEGLQAARLATVIGKPLAARWGKRRVTIGAIGRRDGERFVVGTMADGTVVLGQPSDFIVPDRKKRTPHA
jgi:hypothetical protein